MFCHVWIIGNKICTLCASEISHSLFLLEVDIALITNDSFSLIKWLCKTACFSKWVGTSCSTHVGVLSLKCLCINSDRSSLLIVTLWNSKSQFIVSGKLLPSVHTCLNNENLITGSHIYKLAILGLHDLSAYNVGSHVLLSESFSRSSIKVSLSISSSFLISSLLHLFGNLCFNSFFLQFCFSANLGNSVSFVSRNSIFSVIS